jgi:hypothetical protein
VQLHGFFCILEVAIPFLKNNPIKSSQYFYQANYHKAKHLVNGIIFYKWYKIAKIIGDEITYERIEK